MGRKKKESNIASVMYSYVGTDDQFDEFLKLMLTTISPWIIRTQTRPRILLVR